MPALPTDATRFQKHCPGCFQPKSGVAVCAHCGYDESLPRSPLFLPHGTILGGQYRVGRVLGRPGGFGITYLGWEINLQQRVAIKEYLPRELCQRSAGSSEVDIHSGDDRRGFEAGKEQFLREARIVARLDHPNIVRVRNFFNANATAYLVMDYYEGLSLGDYLSTVRARLAPELAVPLMTPVLEGLQYVHERGLLHRDLKPHNIYLAAIGRPIVLDFGAARQAAGDAAQSLSVVLTEGYAPLEQYQRRAVQGPWTDVYGVAATLYRMLAGVAPPIALDRIGHDPIEEENWPGIPEPLRPTLRMALAVKPADRYQSAAAFAQALRQYLNDRGLGSDRRRTPRPAADAPASSSMLPGAASTAAPADLVAGPRPELPVPSRAPPAAHTMPAPGYPREPSLAPVTASLQTPVAGSTRPATPHGERRPPALGDAPAVTAPMAAPAPPAIPLSIPPLSADVPPLAPPPVSPSRPSRWHARTSLVVALAVMLMALALLVMVAPPGHPGVEPVPMPAMTPLARPVPDPAVSAPAEAATATATTAGQATAGPSLPEMVTLPGGMLQLPSSSQDAASGASISVAIRPFRISPTETTVAQFRDFVQQTGYVNPHWQNYPCESAGGRLPDWNDPGYAQDDDFPVVCVAWADAVAYAQWLSRITGQHYRLPTEAEWEYAARAGTSTQFWWGETFRDGMAACQSCPPKVPTQAAAVKSYPANGFGLYEMSGNVREWTCSAFEPYAAQGAAGQCASGDAVRMAVRGGSWRQPQVQLGSGSRDAYEPYRRNAWTGFRLVQELTP
jgi:formylglycine-generating enzyme required for sulfatase activity/serine/threonine protein kinase